MLTLDRLIELGWVRPWELSGAAMPVRSFYYTNPWQDAVALLSGATGGQKSLVRPGSPRARVLGLVERFVAGDAKAKLIRPQGEAMDPPFVRMRHPNSVAVEMRTSATRTFGFFSRSNIFVALFLETTEVLKQTKSCRTDLYQEYAAKVKQFTSKVTASDVNGVTDVDELVTD